jgi:hypothetical protein
MIFGRGTIALKSGSDEVELNVVEEISHSYIKKTDSTSKQNNKNPKTDGGITIDRAIELSGVLSSSIEILALTRKTAKEKLDTLVKWQFESATIALLGYGTEGILSSIIDLLPASLQFRPKEFSEQFMGTSLDEIENLEIKDIIMIESKDFGNDFGITISLLPQIKIPQVASANSTQSAGKVSKKSSNPPSSPKKETSLLKGTTKGLF